MEISIEELRALTAPTDGPRPPHDDGVTGRFCTVRTTSAGVFAGVVVARSGTEASMVDAIRIWRWEGAASLSELSMVGPKIPSGCKFGVPVPVVLTEVIEIIACSDAGAAAIRAVPSWVA
jgi:hypothetical protein